MQPGTSGPTPRIEPEHFGPLGGERLQQAGPAQLFPGEERFLSSSQLKKRLEQWRAVAPIVRRLLRPDEHVLYVARGVQRPPALQALALGALVNMYHQVVLVITDSRIIEVLLDFRGKAPAGRIRTLPWGRVNKVQVRFLSLSAVPAQGKKLMWSLPVRGDRKLLKLLVPRIQERLRPDHALAQQKVPIWHCPQCLAACAPKPAQCGSCGTLFRTTGMASALSLVFPGAGLLYAGHPGLAALDFLGEIFLFGVLAVSLATSGDAGATKGLLAFGALLLILTKIESIHVGHILVGRTRPENRARRSLWQRFALGGAVLSILALAGAVALTGKFVGIVDRDLEFANVPWSGTREASAWRFFAGDPTMRSQWVHRDGWVVSVFAYPLSVMEDPKTFRATFNQQITSQGFSTVVEDESLPAPLRGFRHISETEDEEGNPVTAINYFVYDPEGKDLHQLLSTVVSEEADQAEARLTELLTHARWIAAVPPRREPAQPAREGRPSAPDRPREASSSR